MMPFSVRRAALAAYDFFAALVCAAILTCGFSSQALAYVDPSVMTYAIQAVAGVAVALSTVAGVAFRRTRKKLFRVLGIDGEARKEREPRYHRLDAGGKPVLSDIDCLCEDGASGKTLAFSFGETNKSRFVVAFLVSLFVAFTLCVVAPYELVSGSAGSLVVRLQNIWAIMACVGIVVAVVVAALLMLFRGKAFDVAAIVVFALGLCCYAQALFLNGGLPQADGGAVDWSSYGAITAVSTIVWILLVAGSVVAARKAPHRTRVVASVASIVFVLVQGVGVASLFVSDAQSQTGGVGVMVSQKGLFDVSANKNIVEFVLDDYDTSVLEDAFAEEPTIFDGFDDFTWFKNSAGSMIPTRYGNVFLLTGQLPREGESFSTFLKSRYERSSYLADIDAAGCKVGIYSDTLGEQYLSAQEADQQIYRYTENIGPFNNDALSIPSTAMALMQCALYRDMPWLAKPAFWFYTDDINNRMLDQNQNDPALTPYLMNDGALHAKLKSDGLSLNDEAASYRYIHILGAHDPFSLDREGNDVGVGNSSALDQAIGSMRIVSSYIENLKELGVYDDTTIVITSDHGTWWSQMSDLETPKSPILLVKPARNAAGFAANDAASSDSGAANSFSAGEALGIADGSSPASALKVSDAPVSAGQILSTIIAATGADNHAYGETLFDAADSPDRSTPRYFYMTASNGVHDVSIDEYEITGDIADISNWRKTGVSWPADE